MNEQILINVTPQETRVAVTEQGAVQELHIERDSSAWTSWPRRAASRIIATLESL